MLRVGTRLTARERNTARTYGKSDSIDALAVARAALREPDLPRATHDPKLRELKLLVDHREDLVGERTAICSRLRWLMHDLDSDLEPFARTLNRTDTRRGLPQRLGRYGAGVQVRICRELLARIGELTRAIDALRAEIAVLVRPMAPGLPGEEAGRRQVHQGSLSLPQTPPGAGRLPGAAGASSRCCFCLNF